MSEVEPKQKQKKKTVVQVVSNSEWKEEEDITELIKESVKEALQKDQDRKPVKYEEQSDDQHEPQI